MPYNPLKTGSIILCSNDGEQITSGDPRNTIYRFNHDQIFRGMGSIADMNDYVGFRISLNNMSVKNTATAPAAATNQHQNVILFTNVTPIISGNSLNSARGGLVLARWALTTTANVTSIYYNTYASDYILPFEHQYIFQISLTTGCTSDTLYSLTGGYQPNSYSMTLEVELIPK